MAFVLLLHLNPKYESMLAVILSRITKMPVTQVEDGMRVEPNCVYVLPPNFSMGISNEVFNLIPRPEARVLHLVINSFFESLAKDKKTLAIGVVLSGTGSDGTKGLMAIKAGGGITFVQTPNSAQYCGMPKSAITSGIVDLVLSPQQIAEELVGINRPRDVSLCADSFA
jgi:two-component system CheB/CheR fusion protein